MELIERLLASEPLAETRPSKAHTCSRSVFEEAARDIIHILLAEEPVAKTPVCEATVHRPRRGTVWVAAFTGPAGRQMWRTTGLTNRDQALLISKQWEAEAHTERATLGHAAQKPIGRVRRPASSTGIGPLSQKSGV
jgi:hypothetical protein